MEPQTPFTFDFDPAASLLFVINASSGSHDPDVTRRVIEAVLAAAGRDGELHFAGSGELASVARQAAAAACARHGAVVAVGGDGTINAVAQAAHAAGCPMGVVPQGTFNYFARTHGLPCELVPAVQALLGASPVPVQVGLINDRLFLVNASLGLYPELLQDREAYKLRFGRSRLVAFAAVFVTLLSPHRQLRLCIERGGSARDLRTPTLFVGNNRLQLEQVGLAQAPALDEGCLAAVMLRPIGALSMLWLCFRGAMGSLGEADTVDSFEFQRMNVRPRLALGRRGVKVAFDGEVGWMQPPLEFRVSPRPLLLLKPTAEAAASPATATKCP